MANKNGSLARTSDDMYQLWPGGYISGPETDDASYKKARLELADMYMRSELRNGRSLKDVETMVRENFPDLQSIQAVYDLEGNLQPKMLWHENMDAAVEADFRRRLRAQYGSNPTQREIEALRKQDYDNQIRRTYDMPMDAPIDEATYNQFKANYGNAQ